MSIQLQKSHLETCHFIRQVENKFLLCLSESILLAIDQHAADERIQLEKLEAEAFNDKGQFNSLPLSVPINLNQDYRSVQFVLKTWGIQVNQRNQLTHFSAIILTYGQLKANQYEDIIQQCLLEWNDIKEGLHGRIPEVILSFLKSKACR
jgi:DNA mismatch repair ATPase MutL